MILEPQSSLTGETETVQGKLTRIPLLSLYRARTTQLNSILTGANKVQTYTIDAWLARKRADQSLNKPLQTLYGGSLGSWIDEERS